MGIGWDITHQEYDTMWWSYSRDGGIKPTLAVISWCITPMPFRYM